MFESDKQAKLNNKEEALLKLSKESHKKHALVLKYLEQHSLIESNIVSFNDFIENEMQRIVNQINEEISRDDIELSLGKIQVGKPQVHEVDGSINPLFPIEAKLRKITYSAPITLEMDIGNKEYTTVEIGKIPIMVKSKYCNLHGLSKEELIKNYEDPKDPGGYFIINGNERVLVMIEDLAQNQSFIEETSKDFSLRLFSSRGAYRIPISITQAPNGLLFTSFSRFKNIPAFLLVKALGITKDSEIASIINKEVDSIVVNLYEFANIQSQEDALMSIGEKMALQGTKKEILDRVKMRLDSIVLPHIGTKPENRREKAITLLKLIRHFLLAKEVGFESDKDHYANKRIRMAGDLLSEIFRVNLLILVRDIQYNLQKMARKKKNYSLKTIAKSTLFSHRIESALATGSWIGQKKGITQNMDKTNGLAILSQIQRIISLLPSEQENFKARTLHPTHYGRFCPIETPEGTNIGLRKNLAMMAKISTFSQVKEEELLKVFEKCGLKIFK